MPDIVLSTLNARYSHASFGLRYLLANLGELAERTQLIEFDINQKPIEIVDHILRNEPKIVGLGVYIWNVDQSTQVVSLLKRIRPELTVILGGPEVSYETDQQPLCSLADYVLTGEADLSFADLCRKLLGGTKPLNRVIPSELPDFENEPKTRGLKLATKRSVALPYAFYDDTDLKNRVIYVEASRGCPFKCEFCLSSLDVPLRNVPVDAFLNAMQGLFDRGLRQFKFVDRTFNLNLNISRAILQFFLDRYEPGLFLHFEMIPDRLPEALRTLIAQFPSGALQFEVGIQTFNDTTAELISRRQDNRKVEENLTWLREQSGVHVHADLIVGLPGEDLQSFGRGFDRLVALRPQEIQVGMLKRLRGTPIVRHDAEWKMVYSPHAPYEILHNKLIDFPTIQRLRRLSRYWDLIANSGNFVQTTPLIWGESSPFNSFLKLSDWLHAEVKQAHAIALPRQIELLLKFLVEQREIEPKTAAESLWADYQRVGRSDRPAALAPYVSRSIPRPQRSRSATPARQAKHLAGPIDAA